MIERKRLVLLSLLIFGAIRIDGMPQVNIHKYEFAAGKHTLLLPKGFLLVLGATAIRLPLVMPVSQVPIRRLIGCSTK